MADAPAPAPPPRFEQRLGVVTHVPHWPREQGGPVAYEPYVREMELWGRLFREVEICAPIAEGPIRGNQAPYLAPNIRWQPVTYSMSYGRRAQLDRLLHLPALVAALDRLVRSSDIVLLRAPGHPALLARILADVRGVRHITKWAGFFGDFPGERLPARAERALARRSNGPVLIYGPASRPHLVSFPPALMSRAELQRARTLARERTWQPPWRILSVGRLLDVKGFDLALRGLGRLRAREPALPWTFTLIGDGPEAQPLRRLAAEAGIADRVDFLGARSFDVVQEHYAQAHAVIMPGVVEGWPKIVAEAWAHGGVPVAAAAGLVPWIMGGRDAGVTFEPTPDGLAAALATLLSAPARMKAMSARGPDCAAELSLESFAERLVRVLVEQCGLR